MSKKFQVRGLFADTITIDEADLARLMEALMTNALLQIDVTELQQNEVTHIINGIINGATKEDYKKWAKPTW